MVDVGSLFRIFLLCPYVDGCKCAASKILESTFTIPLLFLNRYFYILPASTLLQNFP